MDEAEPASLSIALPIIRAAADESRDELQDIWARLLAAAMDPSRKNQVRLELVETVQKMDPLDAALMQKIAESSAYAINPGPGLAEKLGATADEIELSTQNLVALGLIIQTGGDERALTVKGRVLIRAIQD
jgi:hypothetical protein